MQEILFLGFGKKIEFTNKFRYDWFHHIDNEREYSFEDYLVIILNLNNLKKGNKEFINSMKLKLEKFVDCGGILIAVAGTIRDIDKEVTNIDILPGDFKYGSFHDANPIIVDRTSNKIKAIFNDFKDDIKYLTEFNNLPSDVLVFSHLGRRERAFSFEKSIGKGKLFVFPSIVPVLSESSSDNDEIIKSRYLERFVTISSDFITFSDLYPEWLNEIKIFDEKEVKQKFEETKEKLEEYFKIKSILAEDGKVLTKKVEKIFQEMGFRTEEKEIEGNEDILIFDDDGFEGVIECTGSKGNVNIDKLRQLIDYFLPIEKKGIFVVNHFKNKCPKERKNPYTNKCIERSNQLKICLLTVIQLFDIFIKIKEDSALKEFYKKKIKEGIGLFPDV